MNRKVLVIAVALLAAVMLATPLLCTAEACGFRRIWRRSQTFEATFELRNPESEPYPGGEILATPEFFGPTNPDWITPMNTEGHKYHIMKGMVAWGCIDCDQLGIGMMTMNQKFWLHNYETSKGIALLSCDIEFTGEYGDYEGTLTGIFKMNTVLEPPMFLAEGKGSFFKGTDDLKNTKIISNINYEVNVGAPPPNIVYGEIAGRMWGLP